MTYRLNLSYPAESELPKRLERIRRELGERSMSAAVLALVERWEVERASPFPAIERRAEPDPEGSPEPKSPQRGS